MSLSTIIAVIVVTLIISSIAATVGYYLQTRFKPGLRLPEEFKLVRIPIIGVIGAGSLILAEEHIESYILMRKDRAQGIDFALRAKGDSMAGAGIKDGDIVLIRSQSYADNGDIVVVMVSDQMGEFALKRYSYDGQRIYLWSEPFEGGREEYFSVDKKEARKVQILGKVVGLSRL